MQEGKGGESREEREGVEHKNLPFWRVGGILVGNSKSRDFCTPINHYYWMSLRG